MNIMKRKTNAKRVKITATSKYLSNYEKYQLVQFKEH